MTVCIPIHEASRRVLLDLLWWCCMLGLCGLVRYSAVSNHESKWRLDEKRGVREI